MHPFDISIYLIAVLTFGILNVLIWQKVHFDWLSKNCCLLIWSLPFEWFPRIDIAGAGFRLSQLFTVTGFWILTILVLKKNTQLLSTKFNISTVFIFGFLLFSLPSFGVVIDEKRHLVFFLGTILAFGSTFLISHFTVNIWQRLRELSMILAGVSLFGFYQFFGDLAGVPPFLTGLREQYTKIVFGVPRVQGTAIEPLYFAGMLVISIWTFLISGLLGLNTRKAVGDNRELVILNQSLPIEKTPTPNFINHILQSKFLSIFSKNWFLLLLVFGCFILTISKGTFGILALIMVIFWVFWFIRFVHNKARFGRYFAIFIVIISGIFFGLSSSADSENALGKIGTNFVETVMGTSPSAVERSAFVNTAIESLPKNFVLGIGTGQYASFIGDSLGSWNKNDTAIVNNVYLEVLLEEGLISFIFFLLLILYPLWQLGLRYVWSRHYDSFLFLNSLDNLTLHPGLQLNNESKNQSNKKSLASGLVLFFSLFSYYLQWTLFSPIFIMPIFILLGLSYRLVDAD